MTSNLQQVLSGMQSAQWYDHFRGALYPLNLELCRSSTQKTPEVKSLLQIAADYIVQDSTSTMTAVNILPQELCTVLMQQALEGNRDRAVDVLLTKWPLQTLSLKKFAPEIFTKLGVLHDHAELTRVAKQGLRYTTCVAHNFLETLKKKCKTKLKFVDLTGYPTAEVISYYLATHCMLAHNEARQNLMIKKYEEAIKLLPEEEAHDKLERFTTDQSLPDDYFAVKLDLFVSSEPALYEVCKALKVSGFRESTLRLIVDKLDATCLGQPKVAILLEQVSAEHLYGLRLKYNSLSSVDFIRLCPLISQFTHITSLDLSCNTINIFQNDTACDEMAKLFTCLKNLVRLDLSNNRIKSKLRRVLSAVEKPLQFLKLVGCGLALTDMTYLAMSHHTSGIQELDISENGLGLSFGTVLHLLRNIKSHICVLELEDVSLSDSQMEPLNISLKLLTSLMYLNISGNSVLLEKLCDLGVAVAGLKDLQYICMSYPRDCYLPDSDDEQDRLKREFGANFGDVIFQEQARLGITHRVPTIVLSELDQDMDQL
ncbi:leucine-rich repeat-containing protein 14-like [Mercenaria mercenaria]|uniref:leucine-rich repeat-containing protein 14-like n=1 Tax=Mercenaria mercenaria TaxID=6596 RepID=UPI00234FAA57|nr:leucine-rich repeat-containing protein 14-like [Mercenaria mercenaria]